MNTPAGDDTDTDPPSADSPGADGLICVLTGRVVKATEKEQTLQSLIRQLNGEYGVDVERTVQAALHASRLKAGQRPRILSDNGSAYVSRYLKEYLKGESMEHVRCAPFHPMTQPGGRSGQN